MKRKLTPLEKELLEAANMLINAFEKHEKPQVKTYDGREYLSPAGLNIDTEIYFKFKQAVEKAKT